MVPALPAPLFPMKTSPPVTPHETVCRNRLHDALEAALEQRVRFVLLSAPPGYGKTTLLSGWLRVAARLNPITYVLQAMRAIINEGWVWPEILAGVLACVILGGAMYLLTLFALRRRTARR